MLAPTHAFAAGLKLDKDVQRGLQREVELMQKMRHPNIILFMGVVLQPPAVVTGRRAPPRRHAPSRRLSCCCLCCWCLRLAPLLRCSTAGAGYG